MCAISWRIVRFLVIIPRTANVIEMRLPLVKLCQIQVEENKEVVKLAWMKIFIFMGAKYRHQKIIIFKLIIINWLCGRRLNAIGHALHNVCALIICYFVIFCPLSYIEFSMRALAGHYCGWSRHRRKMWFGCFFRHSSVLFCVFARFPSFVIWSFCEFFEHNHV